MQTEHTPGPWAIGPRATQVVTTPEAAMKYAPDRAYIHLLIASTSDDPHPERSVANARLIAAAPDLLAACARALEQTDPVARANDCAMLKAAIEKAVGHNTGDNPTREASSG